jgi:acetyl-CoA synthetase
MIISPKPELIENSYVKDYEKLYKESIEHPEAFWEKIAQELSWFKNWDKVLDWKYPYSKWFVGGKINLVSNALDRHLKTPVADKLALIWVAQDGTDRKYTYKQLNTEVCKFANGLKSLGVKKGDKVTIYLPRIPEQFIAMLACIKIGAIHSVVYSGFSAEALKNRIEDAKAKIVVCTNGYPYGKKVIESIKNVETALKDNKTVEKVIIVDHLKTNSTNLTNSTDKAIFWHDLVAKQNPDCPTEIMEATDPAFILYTSGSTGVPKGVLHAHGGYTVGIYITLKWVFNIEPDDIFWCTADAGWITGHSYILYSPLINGVTTFVYEGTPDYPDIEIWWKLIEKYKVTKFYTAPTAIRSLMRFGEEPLKKYGLSSLKILGSVGEPINPEAWLWFYKNVGHERCPVMDTWWQTETGMIMITPLPSVPLKPGSAFKPFFGVEATVVNDKGDLVPPNTHGYLVIKKPWPSMLLDVYNNSERYKETYFEKIPGVYFCGDSAKIDENGYFWLEGRNDDVIKVSGHRLGSAELENAFVNHHAVAEAAVIGKPHEIKGESIKAFIILKQGVEPTEELKKELVTTVRKSIGPIATPDEIEFVTSLPKTRSGKIMRRVLKAKELGLPVGDTSTLES